MKHMNYRRLDPRRLRDLSEPTIIEDDYGAVIGTFIPAGQEPPFSPPEPPTAAAAVGRPPKPGAGGPGAAAVPSEYEPGPVTLREVDVALNTPMWRLIDDVEKGRR